MFATFVRVKGEQVKKEVMAMQDQGAISYKKYLDGDDQGMVELIRDYKDGLILYLYSFTGSMTEAEELCMGNTCVCENTVLTCDGKCADRRRRKKL